MSERDHHEAIVQHYERRLAEHGDTHRGVDWPNAEDAALRYDVMLAVIRPEPGRTVSLLDFGCGTGHLLERMRARTPLALEDMRIEYTGLDISEEFAAVTRSKFPEIDVRCLDVLDRPDDLPEFDYVVMNGVFCEKRELSWDRMFDLVQRYLRIVWARTRIGLAFNVQTKHVDWERDDLFHVPYDETAAFLKRDLSRHFVLRADYGLWEYTTYVYREPADDR